MILSRFAIPIDIPLFYTYHNGIHNKNSTDYSKIRQIIDKITYKKRHNTIFVSKAVQSDVLLGNKIIGNSKVLPNFTSSGFSYCYQPNSKNEIKLISVGNLRKQKNHEFSIKILSELTDYPVSLDIYGNGTLQKDLEKQIKTTNANVRIISNCIIDAKTLTSYDAFLMSSSQEGMSIAVIEAMSIGLPCILSNIDSFKETAGDSALYFNLSDVKEAKNHILDLIINKQKLIELSDNAKTLSEKYSMDNYLIILLKYYLFK